MRARRMRRADRRAIFLALLNFAICGGPVARPTCLIVIHFDFGLRLFTVIPRSLSIMDLAAHCNSGMN